MTFGERLARHIRAAGLTQVEFARRAGVPPSSVTEWIQGNGYPRHANLQKVAAALGMDLGAFFAAELPVDEAAG